MTTISVNEAIARLGNLAGRDVSVRGLFSFSFEPLTTCRQRS